MSNEDAKKMAKLLQQGATMLDSYCPKCGKILFKLTDGRIICPHCEKEVRIVRKQQQSLKNDDRIKKSNISRTPHQKSVSLSLYQKITQEIIKLFNKLEKIDDMDLYMKVLEAIDLLFRFLGKISVKEDEAK